MEKGGNMRGGRLLVVIGILVVLVAVAAGAFIWIRNKTQQVAEELTDAMLEGEGAIFVLPEGTWEIVVATADIPRGTRITVESGVVTTTLWSETALPEGTLVLTSVEDAYDRIARVDIVQGMPIIEGMLTDKPGDMAAMGSEVALHIPPGKVAYAFSVAGNASVAWAIRPGDHVDVLISLLIVELDEEFQTTIPNGASCVQPAEGEGCQSGVMGRLEVLPNGWVVNLTPGEEQQRPRMVTQLTIQDAIVLRVGEWPVDEEAAPDELSEGEVEQPAEGEGIPTPPAHAAIEPLTVIVTPQDAMVIKYAEEVGASIDLVLRSAGDTGQITTESVTLQYMFDRFNIELPPKLPYGVTPPLLKVRPGAAGEVEGGDIGEPVGE